MNLCGKYRKYQGFDVRTIRNTLTHGRQIFVLIYLAPIHTPIERTLQHKVEPNASAAIITLHKRVGNVA